MIEAAAYILIGGQSRRFGYPKWKARIGNETVLNRYVGVADHEIVVAKVFASTVDNSRLDIFFFCTVSFETQYMYTPYMGYYYT